MVTNLKKYNIHSKSFLLGILILLSALLFSCARSYNPNIGRGSDYYYRVGYPELTVAAIGLFDAKGNPGINVTADVVYGSLIYKDLQDTMRASFNLQIQILPSKKDTSASHGVSSSFRLTIKKKNKEIIHSSKAFTFEKRFPVKPGNYKIYVSVTDLSSGKETVREAHASIPNPASKSIDLTNVLMLGNEPGNSPAYIPITTYDVQGQVDTLKFEFQVSKPDANKPLDVKMQLIEFRSDTMPARPMYAPNPSPSSIQYQGIDYYDSKVVQQQNRILRSETGNILIQYQTKLPKRGNYRFKVTLSGDGVTKKTDFKARDFGVKGIDYPYLRTPRELAAPLCYLMSKKNYRKMMAIHNPDSLKAAIDKFWLGHIKNPQKAKSVLKLYYDRVEQANKQFSNYKEGWKTDLGMIYILFGPPWYVWNSLDTMQWTYGYDRTDPDRNFFFVRPKLKNEYYPFYNYILQRQSGYFTVNYQRVQDWLTGYILDTKY